MGDLKDCLLTAGAGDDPLGQPGVESVEGLAQAAVAILPFCPEARGTQRLPDRPGGGFDTGGLVGDKVDIGGVPLDDPVHDQGVAAAEHESMLGRHLQGDRGHFPLEVTERHYAAAARARTGWRSSQARRTSRGRNRTAREARAAGGTGSGDVELDRPQAVRPRRPALHTRELRRRGPDLVRQRARAPVRSLSPAA